MCLCFVGAACSKPSGETPGGGTSGGTTGGGATPGVGTTANCIENKEVVATSFNSIYTFLTEEGSVEVEIPETAEMLKSLYSSLAGINKQIDLDYEIFSVLDNSVDGLQYFKDDEGNLSLSFGDNQISLTGVVDGVFGGYGLAGDENGIYIARVVDENFVAWGDVKFIPYNILDALLANNVPNLAGSSITGILDAMLQTEGAITTIVESLPKLTADDIDYDATTKEHTIKVDYVKGLAGAIIEEVAPEQGASSAKMFVNGLLDELNLKLSFKVADDNTICETKVAIDPTEEFFEAVFGLMPEDNIGLYAESLTSINTLKIEVIVSDTGFSFNFNIGNGDNIKAIGSIVAVGSEEKVTANVDVEVKYDVAANMIAIDALLDVDFVADNKGNLTFKTDVLVNGPQNLKFDFDSSLVVADNKLDLDVNCTDFTMRPEYIYDLPEEVQNAITNNKAQAVLKLDADLTTGDATGSFDVSAKSYSHCLETDDDFAILYEKMTIDVDAKLNLFNLLGAKDKVVIDTKVVVEETTLGTDLQGNAITLPDEEKEWDVKTNINMQAKNTADGVTKIVIESIYDYMYGQGLHGQKIEVLIGIKDLDDTYQGKISDGLLNVLASNIDNFNENYEIVPGVNAETYIRNHVGDLLYNPDNELAEDETRIYYISCGNNRYCYAQAVGSEWGYSYVTDSGYMYAESESLLQAIGAIKIVP